MGARRADAQRRSAVCRAALTALVLALPVAACHGNAVNTSAATATDEWSRSLPLPPDGEVRITNRTGRIEVAGVSGSSVEIRAERIVRAATEQKARDLLSKIAMTEETSSDHVAVATEGIPGILIGVSVEVNFHVRMPQTARLRVQLTNGDVTADGIEGSTVLSTTNGRVTGANLRGATEAHVVNGRINLDIAGFGDRAAVSATTTNGSVDLKVPLDANGTLSAATVNGQVHVIELPFTPDAEADGDRRRGRRTSGQINAGGTPINLRTVNGSITVRPR
jgi:hypothetical protein